MSEWSPRELGGSIADVFRTAFVTGVAVIVPLLVSLIVLAVAGQYVYQYLDLFSTLVLDVGPEAVFTVSTPLGPMVLDKEALIELFTPVVLVCVILTMGLFINSTRLGAAAVEYFDAAMALVPGIGSVYESFRQMSDVMLEEDTQNFREVKLVEFPHEGAYTLGFVTTETPDPLRSPTGHDRMLTLFLPLAPNPVMGGHLVHMPAGKVMDVDMTVEEGIRAVVTSGVAVSGGSATGDSGLSEAELRSLAGVEHADQQLDPSADSPDIRRSEGVDMDRDETWDRQVDPSQSTTPTDIARRTRAQREALPDDAFIDEKRQPDSLYSGEEVTTTPAREAGRYRVESEETMDRPAEEADRPASDRDGDEAMPAERAGRPTEARADSDGRPEVAADRDGERRESEPTRPAEAGDRPPEERDDTEGRPAEVRRDGDISAEDDE